MARGGVFSIFKFFVTSLLMVTIWLVLSMDPIKQLHDSYTALQREREQVALQEQQVQLLQRQLESTKAFGSDFEIQLRQAGMAKPYEKVIFIKPALALPEGNGDEPLSGSKTGARKLGASVRDGDSSAHEAGSRSGRLPPGEGETPSTATKRLVKKSLPTKY